MTQTLLILGATGEIGRRILAQALAHPDVAQVVAPTRRPLPAASKLHNPVVDYSHLPTAAPWWAADAALCALGTTMRQAGSQAAFAQVDHHHVLHAAQATRQAGTPCFVFNSSLGADATSRNFYLRTKGQTEDDLSQLGFASLTLVRPGILDVTHRADPRPAEALGLWVVKARGDCAGAVPGGVARCVGGAHAAQLAAGRAWAACGGV